MLETWARPTCVLGEGVVMSRCPQRQVVLASVAVRRDWLGHVRGQQLQGEQAALGFADLAEACLAESLAVDDARANAPAASSTSFESVSICVSDSHPRLETKKEAPASFFIRVTRQAPRLALA